MSSRVLLIDAISTNRIAKTAFLEAMQYDVVAVPDFAEATDISLRIQVDLIVLGALREAPSTVFSRLTSNFLRQNVPCPPVLCLLDEDSADERLKLLESGVRSVLQEPVDEALFLATARRYLRAADTFKELARRRAAALSFGFADSQEAFVPARRIAVVGSGPDSEPMRARLSEALGYNVVHLMPNDALRDQPGERAIDVYIVLSDAAKETRMRHLLPELRLRNHSRNASVLVLYRDDDPNSAAEALNSGAADAVPLSASKHELALRTKAVLRMKSDEDALRQSSENSFRLATTDDLTGLFNRRYAEAYMTDIVTRAEVSGHDMTLMVIDIDHFKSVNDSFGHAAGDEVLKAVAARIRDNLRAVDLVARFGGEEFLVAMPDTGVMHAEMAADRLRSKIASEPILLAGFDPITVTASIGVSVCNPLTISAEALNGDAEPRKKLIERIFCDADAALYRAKKGGRDQVNLTLTAA